MAGLNRVADWWDSQKNESENIMQEWVNKSDSSLELYTKITVAMIGSTAMTLGAGFVDTLRLGEGIKKGGTWGYAQDALRLLSLAGPILKLGRLGLAKWTFDPGGGICAFVSSAKALRQTGVSLFIKVSDIIAKSPFKNVTDLKSFIPVLQSMGVRFSQINSWHIGELKTLAQQNRKGVIYFAVNWTGPNGPVAHALYAFRDTFGFFRIADRTGKIVSSLKELDSLYPGIGSAVSQGSAIAIYNAAIIEGTSVLSMLAVEVNAFLSTINGEKAVVLSPVNK